jgi:hypothetical protein
VWIKQGKFRASGAALTRNGVATTKISLRRTLRGSYEIEVSWPNGFNYTVRI